MLILFLNRDSATFHFARGLLINQEQYPYEKWALLKTSPSSYYYSYTSLLIVTLPGLLWPYVASPTAKDPMRSSF